MVKNTLSIKWDSEIEGDFFVGFPPCHPSLQQFQIPSINSPLTRVDLPDFETWQTNVQKALKHIEAGTFDKVVLARQTTFTLPESIDPANLFAKINAHSSTTKFCIQIGATQAFLGATPEKLFTRTGRQLTTMALAGTRKRGATPDEDTDFTQELLSSKKDLREVNYVRDELYRLLSPLAETIEIGPLTILKNSHVQHLHYPIDALLKQGVTDQQLIAMLHPTPALGGYPRKEALEFIKTYEPFSRGWYGSPIGWSSPEKADVAVAIRSAWINENQIHLYAGTGIVQGSDPLAEWEELEHKISMFKEAVDVQ